MRRLVPLVVAALATSISTGPATAGPPALRSFTIAASGDILIHGRVAMIADRLAPGPEYDFTPMLAPTEPWIGEADLAICHLEGTLSPTNTGLTYFPRFVGPHEVAAAIAATGYDTCSLAGNHAMDRGFSGVVDTIEILDRAGLGHAGTAASEQGRLPELIDVAGVTVAHLSYTYGLNGIPLPRDKPWAANIVDVAAIREDAAWARGGGAEFVVLSIHWGSENTWRPTATQSRQAREIAETTQVDLILGSHAHVVQPIERIGDTVVVYGMGNHLSNQNSYYGPSYYSTEDGVMVHITVDEQPDGRFVAGTVRFTPTWVRLSDYEVLPVLHALELGLGDTRLLNASHARTRERVLALEPNGVIETATPWPVLRCAGRPATIVGSPEGDLLIGTDATDVIVGRGGNDTIDGFGGNDLICGGAGDDRLFGGRGHDLMIGGDGDDRFVGGPGSDIAFGGEGDDVLADDGVDRLAGGPGNDRVAAP